MNDVGQKKVNRRSNDARGAHRANGKRFGRDRSACGRGRQCCRSEQRRIGGKVFHNTYDGGKLTVPQNWDTVGNPSSALYPKRGTPQIGTLKVSNLLKSINLYIPEGDFTEGGASAPPIDGAIDGAESGSGDILSRLRLLVVESIKPVRPEGERAAFRAYSDPLERGFTPEEVANAYANYRRRARTPRSKRPKAHGRNVRGFCAERQGKICAEPWLRWIASTESFWAL